MARERTMTLDVPTETAALTTEDMLPTKRLSRAERARLAAKAEAPAPTAAPSAEQEAATAAAIEALAAAEEGRERIVQAITEFVEKVNAGAAAMDEWKRARSAAHKLGADIPTPPLYDREFLPPTGSWHSANRDRLDGLRRAVTRIVNL